jgi:hypothetical protein
MKFKIALVVALVAGLTLSLAVAAPAKGPKNTTTTTTTTTKGKKPVCTPTVSLILNGKYKAANDTQTQPAFDMTVTAASKLGKAYKKLGVATVLAPAATKITLNGKKVTLDKLAAGDRLSVQARVCKKSIPAGNPTAKRVTAKRPKHA